MAYGIHLYLIIATYLVCASLCTLTDKKYATKSDTLRCKNEIPTTLPAEVRVVYITIDRYDVIFQAKNFTHKSWESVSLLDITAQYTAEYGNFSIRFQSGCFQPLQKLKILRFHGDMMTYINANALSGNLNLTLLEFTLCPNFLCEYFSHSLLSFPLAIENLTLSKISERSGNYCTIDDTFVKMIAKCNIGHLSLSGSTVIAHKIVNLPKIGNLLRSLDISKVYIVITKDLHSIYETYDKISDGLVSLNISAIPIDRFLLLTKNSFKDKSVTQCIQLKQNLLLNFFFKVENAYADEILTNSFKIDNTFLNISTCPVKTRTIQLRRNHLKYINMTLYLPKQNNVTEIDFSFNELIFLSPYTINTATSLLTLNLNSNKLRHMEHLVEFRELLRSFAELRKIGIARNGITNLPSDFFGGNSKLQIMDLSENELETLTCNLKNMSNLQVLNLSLNRIHFLEGKSLGYVQFYLFRKVVLDFSGNPIECSCRSINFVKWLISDLQPYLNQKYTCDIEGEKSKVNQYSLKHSNFLCYRTVIFVSAAVLVLGIIVLLIYIYHRNRVQKEKCAQKRFLKYFLKGNLQEQFLCQISYASEDEACVLNTIHPNLEAALYRNFEINGDAICLGDTHFNLGRSIVNEILRCISETWVMIFVISEHFCESQWCEMELREAYESNKPFITIFKEEVQEDKMSPLLSAIFNRFTRAKLVINEGQYKLIPDWKSLSESIIKLASNSYIVNLDGHKHRNNPRQDDETKV